MSTLYTLGPEAIDALRRMKQTVDRLDQRVSRVEGSQNMTESWVYAKITANDTGAAGEHEATQVAWESSWTTVTTTWGSGSDDAGYLYEVNGNEIPIDTIVRAFYGGSIEGENVYWFCSYSDFDERVKVSYYDQYSEYLEDQCVTTGTFVSGSAVAATDTPLAYETLNFGADEELALAFDIGHLTTISTLNDSDLFIVSVGVADESRAIAKSSLVYDLDIGAGAAITLNGGTINFDPNKQAVDNTLSIGDWFAYEQAADNAIKACTVQGLFDSINVLPAETVVATGDKFAMYDVDASNTDAITASNLISGLVKILTGYNASNLQVVANDSGTIKLMETIDLEAALALITGFGASKTLTTTAGSVIGWT